MVADLFKGGFDDIKVRNLNVRLLAGVRFRTMVLAAIPSG